MQHPDRSEQTETNVKKNIEFFKDFVDAYSRKIEELDTYQDIHAIITAEVRGLERLLDVGNGGVFDYDATVVKNIVALDLFLDPSLRTGFLPPNVVQMQGSALQIPYAEGSFDGVLISMVLHHLVGRSAQESWSNCTIALREAHRVLKTGGKLILVESCVPVWFYTMEKTVFPIASRLIEMLIRHPPTLQYPASLLSRTIAGLFSRSETTPIPKGRWIIQFGYKFPSALTPAAPYLITAVK